MGVIFAVLLMVLPLVALVALVVGLVQSRWGLAGGAVGLLVACALLTVLGLRAGDATSTSVQSTAVRVSP